MNRAKMNARRMDGGEARCILERVSCSFPRAIPRIWRLPRERDISPCSFSHPWEKLRHAAVAERSCEGFVSRKGSGTLAN